MPYELVLSEPPEPDVLDDRGFDTVFFDNLPSDHKVYVLYYPGISLNKELAEKLESFGELAGKNLFVNIGRIDDPNYRTVVKKFGIRNFPTIIVTALDNLASPPTEYSTAYVKIDNKNLLNSTDLAFQLLEKIYNLFIDEKISEAMSATNKQIRKSRLNSLKDSILKGLGNYEFYVDTIIGRFGVKPKGG